MSTDVALAREQAALVAALVGSADAPAGFALERTQAVSTILLGKRRKAVAHALPGLAHALGASFREHFATFARSQSVRNGSAALDDALAFSAWLERRGLLPREFRLRLRLRVRRAMLRLRRW